jgi:hypothetical protein
VARAQTAGNLPIIGSLGPSTLSAVGHLVAAFVQRLHELGWRDGQNVAIASRWAQGRAERLSELAVKLVGRKVNVIVTHGNVAIAAAKSATSDIPIVFATGGRSLYEAVQSILVRSTRWSWLKAWAMKIAPHRGMRRAAVAPKPERSNWRKIRCLSGRHRGFQHILL